MVAVGRESRNDPDSTCEGKNWGYSPWNTESNELKVDPEQGDLDFWSLSEVVVTERAWGKKRHARTVTVPFRDCLG